MTIRFCGVAAPEWDAPGGQEATDAIKDIVLGKQVRCELTGKQTYDRCVGVCYLNGINIEEQLVRIGLARDCPRFQAGGTASSSRRQRTRAQPSGKRTSCRATAERGDADHPAACSHRKGAAAAARSSSARFSFISGRQITLPLGETPTRSAALPRQPAHSPTPPPPSAPSAAALRGLPRLCRALGR
jgi:hypothetical protein